MKNFFIKNFFEKQFGTRSGTRKGTDSVLDSNRHFYGRGGEASADPSQA